MTKRTVVKKCKKSATRIDPTMSQDVQDFWKTFNIHDFMTKHFPSIQDLGDVKRTWKVIIDGEEVPVEKTLLIISPKGAWGNVCYGKIRHYQEKRTPPEFDGVTLHSNSGGGTVTLMYAIKEVLGNKKILVSIVTQERPRSLTEKVEWKPVQNDLPTQSLKTYPRGFLDLGKTREDNVKDEATEVGFELSSKADDLGCRVNMDSGWFAGYGPAEGISFHAQEINPDILVQGEWGKWQINPNHPGLKKLPDDVLEPLKSRAFEDLFSMLRQESENPVSDGFLQVGGMLFLNYLEREGKIKSLETLIN